MAMTDMMQQLTTITPAEGVLLILATASLIQCAIFWVQVNAAATKDNAPHFPGLMSALADIPARAELKAKQRGD